MTRDEILAAAQQCVSGDRAATHGDARANFSNVAMLWSAYMRSMGWEPSDAQMFTEHDVGTMLALFKVARIVANPSHADSWVDAIGYLSLAGELSTAVDRV